MQCAPRPVAAPRCLRFADVKRVVGVGVWSEHGRVPAVLTDALVRHADKLRWCGAFAASDTVGRGIDVLVVEVPGRLDGLEPTLRSLLDQEPGRSLALVSDRFPPTLRVAARALGVRALVASGLGPDEFAAALIAVASGDHVEALGRRIGWPAGQWIGRAENLSERESQVLVLCAQGLTNREIADRLYLNIETVKSHLKRVYQRLGLRNRAEATAFVHRARNVAGSASFDVLFASDDAVSDASPSRGRSLAAELGLDDRVLQERQRLMGIEPDGRRSLAGLTSAVMAGAAEHLERSVARWRANDATSFLVADDDTAARVMEHQRRYLATLFGGEVGPSHVEAMLRTGATHHRLGLQPQWYVASLAPVVCEHLPVIFARAADKREAVEQACALISAVLFDACLTLDAYELSIAHEVRDGGRPSVDSSPSSVSSDNLLHQQGANDAGVSGRSVTKVSLSVGEIAARRAFLGLGESAVSVLREMGSVIDAAMPSVLKEFYDLIDGNDELAGIVPHGALPRLMQQVATYWSELTTSEFDTVHAASRLRVGLIHERIGLAPQHYLAGVAQQLTGVLRLLDRTGADLMREIDALVRVVFFDMAFVIDAYLDARMASLVDASRFAAQVVSSLSTGVAVVDARGRVEYANDQLLDYVGVSAAVVLRMPVQHALRLEGVAELVVSARTSPTGRVSQVFQSAGRTLRATAVALRRAITDTDGFVALVVDDLTDVVRASVDAIEEDRRMGSVLAAVGAVAWELDHERLVVVAVSRSVDAVLGVRDVDIVGRGDWIELVHVVEREEVVTRSRALAPGGRDRLVHRLRHADGQWVWAETTMIGTTSPEGHPRTSAVSVVVPPPHLP